MGKRFSTEGMMRLGMLFWRQGGQIPSPGCHALRYWLESGVGIYVDGGGSTFQLPGLYHQVIENL